MQLQLHYYWLKSLNSLCNGLNSGLCPVICKVTLRHSYTNTNRIEHGFSNPYIRQFCMSIKNLSAKKKHSFNNAHYNDLNVKPGWDIEDIEFGDKYEKNDTYESASSPMNREYITQEELLINKLNEALRIGQTTYENWEAIKTSIMGMTGIINEENIDAIIMKQSAKLSLSLSKSYFKYLKSTNKQINRATYGNYLQAFYTCSSSCKDDDLKEILQVYKEILTVYPILDSSTTEKVVFALTLTESWKEYDKLFNEIKKSYKPSGFVYGAVIKTSFKHGEVELGWQLTEELMLNYGNVYDDIFISWLEKNNKMEDLIRVIQFLSKFNSMPSSELSNIVMETYKKINSKGKGVFTTILKSGICKHCNSKLEKAWVSSEDYNHLKSAFLNPVLIGKDIFIKTEPNEFNKFLKFLDSTAPYDVVLDGLNIALKVHKSKRTPKVFAVQLKSVVKHFTDQNKKVLVIGRQHMNTWPKEEMKCIYDNAHVFLADNISQDDPFLLYATLYSGSGTCFVSQDMMRGHKFLLGDAKLQDTFHKWQAQHQYFINYINQSGFVNIQDPVQFMQTIQQNSVGDWHIPYEVKEDLTTKSRVDNYHRHWLCLTSRTIQQSDMQKENYYQEQKYYEKKNNYQKQNYYQEQKYYQKKNYYQKQNYYQKSYTPHEKKRLNIKSVLLEEQNKGK